MRMSICDSHPTADQTQAEALRSLLEVGTRLGSVSDADEMLKLILREACRLERSQGGCILLRRERELVFAAAHDHRGIDPEVEGLFAGRTLGINGESLAGYVAMTGQWVNLADATHPPAGAPYRVDHSFEAEGGFRFQSILAIPLRLPDGLSVGVMELFNRLDAEGNIVPFPDAARDALLSLSSTAAVTIHNAMLQDQLRQAHRETILRLSVASEYRDDDTGEHVRRMSRNCGILARAMGLPLARAELIEYASPMHDIGKIGIPDCVLRKPGSLSNEERRLMQQHTVIGGRILENPENELIAKAREVALSHHEKWDGSGYPAGLKGTQIPLSGRIAGLADVFDALVSKRCYKDAMPFERAVEIIRDERGGHFDPDIVDAFFNVTDEVLTAYEKIGSRPLARSVG